MIADLRTILWKEWRDFRRQIVGQVGFFLLFAVPAGIVVPAVALREGSAVSSELLLSAVMLVAALYYATMLSDSSFQEERSENTMPVLLATALRPLAVFVGKWMWIMLEATVFIVVVNVCDILVSGLVPDRRLSLDIGWSLSASAFAWCLCSYAVAVNAIVSLVMPDPKVGRLIGNFASFLPLLLAYGLDRWVGLEWDRWMMLAVGVGSIALSVVSFVAAGIAFRSERIRL